MRADLGEIEFSCDQKQHRAHGFKTLEAPCAWPLALLKVQVELVALL
jgi:hypothetical protein